MYIMKDITPVSSINPYMKLVSMGGPGVFEQTYAAITLDYPNQRCIVDTISIADAVSFIDADAKKTLFYQVSSQGYGPTTLMHLYNTGPWTLQCGDYKLHPVYQLIAYTKTEQNSVYYAKPTYRVTGEEFRNYF